MSDDEEVIYKKPQKTIHYGSLETTEWAKQQTEEIQSDEDDYEPEAKRAAFTSAVSAPSLTPSAQISNAGNINVSNEYYELEKEMCVHRAMHNTFGYPF